MKLYILLVLLTYQSVAQLSTDSTIVPTFEYDMLTLQASVLKDLSGSGNNSGTITGTTTTSQGRTCNGSSDWIAMSQLLATGNFTVLALATSTNTGIATWAESNTNATQFVRFSTTGGGNFTLTGASTGVSLPLTFTVTSPDWDIYMMRRVNNQMDGAVLSRLNGYSTALNTNIGTITVTGGGAAICALNEGATQVNFWSGTLGYLIGFNFALTDQQVQAVYNAIAAFGLTRSIFVHPYPQSIIPAYTTPVWSKKGIILCTQVTVACNEPAALYDSTCPLTGAGNCFSLWYSVSNANIGYAESPDTTTWTNNGSIGTSVITGCIQPSVVKIGSTYHMFCINGSGVNSKINHYTSTNKTIWTLSASGIITTSTNVLGSQFLANPSALFNPDGSGKWYLLFDCNGANATFTGNLNRTCGATTTDVTGNTGWAYVTASPILGVSDAGIFNTNSQLPQTFGNPDLHYIPSAACPWWEWDGSFGIMRFASCTFNDLWIFSQLRPSLSSGAPTESNQLSDPSLIEVNGKTYMFYNAYSTNSTGFGAIKLAVANMPLAILITTNEGVAPDWP